MTALQLSLKRYWLDLKRFRAGMILIAIILVIIVFFAGVIYPGESFFGTFFDIPVVQAIFGELPDLDNPGLLVWYLLLFSLFANLVYPVMGIFFGARILPWGERDGKELIFSTEKSLLRYFLQNLVLVSILIPLVVLPAYLVSVGMLSSGGGGVPSFTIAFILPLFFAFVVMMVTSMGCAMTSSPRTGYALGGLFFIVSFTLDFLQQEIDFVKDINLMTQIGAMEHALDTPPSWNEDFIVTCLFLVILLTALTLVFLYRVDYIKTRSTYQEETVGEEKNTRLQKISDILSALRKFVGAPVESILSQTGWKFPAFRDQLQSLAGIFLLYAFITSALLGLVVLVYPGDEAMAVVFADLDIIFESPIIAAFLFGHSLVPTLAGFLMYKVLTFHWIFYGPFLFITTYSILLRDKNAGYDEITWSMPRTRTLVTLQRTVAVLVYLWVIFLINFIVLYTSQLILSTYADVVLSDFGVTALTFIFLGIGYSIILVLFVALASIPRSKYIAVVLLSVFLIAIFIPIITFLNDELSWLLYLTPFYYFDVAGIFMEDIFLEKVIPEIIGFGIIILAFYAVVTTRWMPTRDIH